MLCILCKSIHS